jgi:hypothetical protein
LLKEQSFLTTVVDTRAFGKYKNIPEENFNQFHVLHVVNYSGVRSRSKAIEERLLAPTHIYAVPISSPLR